MECAECAKLQKTYDGIEKRMASRGNFGIVSHPRRCKLHKDRTAPVAPAAPEHKWTYSYHEQDYFLDYGDTQAGILFVGPGIPCVRDVVKLLNAGQSPAAPQGGMGITKGETFNDSSEGNARRKEFEAQGGTPETARTDAQLYTDFQAAKILDLERELNECKAHLAIYVNANIGRQNSQHGTPPYKQ